MDGLSGLDGGGGGFRGRGVAGESGAAALSAEKHLPWVNFLGCVMIFSEGLRFEQTSVGEVRLQYLLIFPMLVSLMFFLRGVYMSLPFTIAFIALGAASFWNVIHGKDTYLLMFKQIFGIYANAMLFYMILKLNDWDPRPLFRMYLKFCIPIAAFGIIQECAYVLHLKWIYDLSWLIPYRVTRSGSLIRINSIMSEPSSLGMILTPAFLAAFESLRDSERALLSTRQCLIILVAVVLTMSTTAYVGVFACLILLMINFGKVRYVLLMIILVPALSTLAYVTSPDVKRRIDDTMAYVNGNGELEKINLSSFALFSNMHVAAISFSENPWIGSGLGSHPVSYDKNIGNVVDLGRLEMILNREDANSLFLRLMSETGLMGLGLMFWFLFRFRLPMSRDRNGVMWVINNGIFALLVVRIIRFGHYFETGYFAFFWMYYFSYKFGLEGHTIEADGAKAAAPELPLPGIAT